MSFKSLLLSFRGQSLTSFFNLTYITAFLPLCLIFYSITPTKKKKYFLLFANCVFFWLISGKLVIYLFLTIFSMHYFGLWIDRVQTQMRAELKALPKEERGPIKEKYVSRQRAIVSAAAIMHIGVLIVLKYTAFFGSNINTLFNALNVPITLTIPNYLMPIGISFFTLQAVSYINDVYHGLTKADDNIFRLALFISFFPQIVEGPICRYNQTAEQLWNVKPINYVNLTLGIQRIMYGFMKKAVVADRLNAFMKNYYATYMDYQGGMVVFGAVLYTIQLYMDFSGSMDAVLGTAQIFGIELPENFKRPFFSKTISEFWTRWHITLGTWFKDYVFYPVTTGKRMKKITSSARKKIGNHYGPLVAGSIALFCVWFSNGLWHGSSWNYIFFGLYHFTLILTGNLISPLVKTVNKKLHINPQWKIYKGFQIVRTVILVFIGELFFRAHGLVAGCDMFKRMVTDFSFDMINSETFSKLGIDYYDFAIVGVTLIIVLFVSIMNEKGICLREKLAKKNIVIRWAVLYAMLMYIVIFGAYGLDYVPVDPLYAKF